MKLRFMLLSFFLCASLYAQQNAVELSYNPLRYDGLEKINRQSDQFDFNFQNNGVEKKSVGKALLYSLILPGAGEFYVGESGHGKFFLGLEILAWGGYFFNNHHYSSLQGDYKAYASLHADVSKPGKDDQYWIDIGKFDDIYAYNDQRRRDRRVDDIYEEESGSNYWSWDSRDNRFTYDAKRLKAVAVKNRDVYFVTAILVNHLVSAINAVRLARRHNRNLAQNTFDYQFVVNTLQPQNTYVGFSFTKRF